jgi:xanthosine utilization system XapX-like protein
LAYSPNQLKASKKLALASGCLCFVFLLFLTLFYHRIPSLDSLGFILIGSSLVGLLGYYLGTVIYSHPKQVAATKSQKTTSNFSGSATVVTTQPPAHAHKETRVDEKKEKEVEQPTVLSESEGNQGKLQESIPAVADSHSEHEWLDTASLQEVEDASESKAFEA